MENTDTVQMYDMHNVTAAEKKGKKRSEHSKFQQISLDSIQIPFAPGKSIHI